MTLIATCWFAVEASAQAAAAVRLTVDGCYKTRPLWLPDGSRLAFAKHAGRRIDLVSVAANGADERKLGESRDQKLSFDAALSPDRKLWAFSLCTVASNQGDVDVFLMDFDGSKPRLLIGNEKKLSHEEWPSWSPDGKKVAVSSTSPGNQEIVIVDVDGKNRKRLTQHPGIDAHPAWSPDGKTIAFATDRWGSLEIAALAVDSMDVRRLTQSPGLDDYPSWSPDGKRIAFVSNRDGNLEIYTMHANGSEPKNQTRSPSQDTYPCWMPDGKRLTFVRGSNQRFDVYRIDADGF